MADIALLDGGTGQEVNKRGPDVSHPLWSVKVMFDSPTTVLDVHVDFIKAGARVICVNTYAATPTRMQRHGFGERIEEAHDIALELAHTAVRTTEGRASGVDVAGCIPPLVASYRSDVSKSYDESVQEYSQIVELQKDHVDLFLIETMSNIEETVAALDAVSSSGLPVYVGFTLTDDLSATLRSGERLEDAIEAIRDKAPDGVLLNCSVPEAITHAMPVLAAAGVRFGAYANGFTSISALEPDGTVDVLKARLDLTADTYADHVAQWVESGASIVGGCCEVGPEHIGLLADRLQRSGHGISRLSSSTT